MAGPKLTIGMAHYKDFDGVYFTIQALRIYHAQVMEDCEILVVDNSPAEPEGQHIKNFLDTVGCRYVPMSEPVGTSASRNRVFEEANGEFVLCMDCHVLLAPGSLKRLLDFYEQHPNTDDLYQGPLVFDHFGSVVTQFDDFWRSQMWGIWGTAWQCPCKSDNLLSMNEGDNKKVRARLVAPGEQYVDKCPSCGKHIPKIAWDGHENQLEQLGYVRVGFSDDYPPFEIPGMGLGLFSCRREAWQGFNPHARGFGGEELYIQGKFRAAGHKAYCLPFLKWVHRFGRPEGVPYPVTLWNKVRNYVLEFTEMGWPLDPIYEHFVENGNMPKHEWDILVEDPIKNDWPYQKNQNNNPYASIPSIEAAYEALSNIERDLDQHMPTIREYAEKVETVAEFSIRKESTVALLAAKPKKMVSYNTEEAGLVKRCVELAVEQGIDFYGENKHSTSVRDDQFKEVELLFLNTQHTYGRLLWELKSFGVKATRFIIMHNTQIYRAKGEDGGAGLEAAMKEFMKENPEWSVIRRDTHQHGLTVLGCQEQDKPKLPSKIEMAKNFAKSRVEHYSTGAKAASEELYNCRLEVCSTCHLRNNDRCSVCGCPIAKKASEAASTCPNGWWEDYCGKGTQQDGETEQETA